MTDRQGGEHGSLFSALKSIGVTLLASGRTRLELLGNELEVGKARAVQMLLLAQGMAFCLAVGLLLAIAWLTVLYWDHRVIVLGALTGSFLFLGGVFFALLRRSKRDTDHVFAASIAELKEDLRQLKEAVGHESPAD